MSKRITDKYDDVHFSSDRFFFSDGQWFYTVRTYDGSVTNIGGFATKEIAMEHCDNRFTNKIDYFQHGSHKV